MKCHMDTKLTLEFLFTLIHGESMPPDYFTAARMQAAIESVNAAGADAVEQSVASYHALSGGGAVKVLAGLVQRGALSLAQACEGLTPEEVRALKDLMKAKEIARCWVQKDGREGYQKQSFRSLEM